MKRLRRGNREDAASTPWMGARLNLLIGERRRLVVVLSFLSVISSLAEGLTLSIFALVAVSLTGNKHHLTRSLLHVDASVGLLILIALGLVLFRAALQLPLSKLPSRIAGDVQAGLRKRLFHAFTQASW